MPGRAVAAHCRSLIERAGPACVAVKPQLACFERLGAPGWAALAEVCEAAARPGCWWSRTASAATCRSPPPPTRRRWSARRRRPGGRSPGLGADAFTANPLLGRDALEPLVEAAAAAGAGVFALVRTSNPGAADIQDLPAPEQPLHERLAALVDGLSDRLLGDGGLERDGRGGRRDRAGAPRPPARADAALDLPHPRGRRAGRAGRSCSGAAFAAGPASGLVAASRGIAADPDPAAAAERLRAAVWEVSTA